MAEEPKREPGAPGSSANPVQRAFPSDEFDWLIEPEDRDLVDKIDRLTGDVEVVTLLALSNYEGERWDVFATELAKYGMAVIGGWMFKGLIYQKCREKNFGLAELGRPFTHEEIEELRGETVAKALFHFRRDVLMTKKWDSTKGASLRTYFVGQCILRFANIYREFRKEEMTARAASRADDHDLLNDPGGLRTDDFQLAAAHRDEIERALAAVKDPRVRQAMLMTAIDKPQSEIAELLGVSEKTVERMLSNERKRQEKRRAG
jgi:RNA polymerase sigma factor (sigma-70 family)